MQIILTAVEYNELRTRAESCNRPPIEAVRDALITQMMTSASSERLYLETPREQFYRVMELARTLPEIEKSLTK